MLTIMKRSPKIDGHKNLKVCHMDGHKNKSHIEGHKNNVCHLDGHKKLICQIDGHKNEKSLPPRWSQK